MFKRKVMCKTCPFRKNGLRHLGNARASDIISAIFDDKKYFQCHKDNNREEKNMCVGSMLMLESKGRPNQMMRIGERVGEYDRMSLKGIRDCILNPSEWVKVQSK